MKNDLIRREDAIRAGREIPDLIFDHYFGNGDVEALMNAIPTVDAVEVVRCRDCKHRGIVSECPMCYTEDSYDDDYGYEYWDVDKTVDEGFCHCGEKADTEVEG